MTNFRELCAELVSRWDNAVGDPDFCDVAEAMDRARAALAEPEPVNPWKEALIDALVVDFLLDEENSNDPKRAIHDLIKWNVQLAREPLLAEGAGVGPSEKEQAMMDLDWIQDNQPTTAYDDRFDTIRRALEQLDG